MSGSRASARSTSRQITLPEPSQTPLTGLWRYSRGMTDSSTNPFPPRHSRASAACCGARLQVQYFTMGVSRRWSRSLVLVGAAGVEGPGQSEGPRRWPPRTRWPGRRGRWPSGAVRTGGARRRARWAACHVAWATPWRMIDVEPRMQSSLVWLTISMMVRTPRPSSPINWPETSASSISLDAFDRSPSLSFSRWIRMGFRVPSGLQRGTRKQLIPPGAWASIKKASDIGAEQNHLCPVSR